MFVYSSHFVDRDQVANECGAVCDGAKFRYKSLKNEISAAAYYSNHGKYSFGSAIFEYSRIFEQFVSTLHIFHTMFQTFPCGNIDKKRRLIGCQKSKF